MRVIRLAVLLAAVALSFWNLWEGSLRPWDESITAERSREIVSSGHWFTIHYQRLPDYQKPPLYYWLTALSFRALGQDEFTVRLWSVLFGLGCLYFVYRLARQSTGSDAAGGLAALVLLLNPHWMNRTREGLLESGLILGLLGAGYFLTFAAGRRRALVAGLFLALGAMVKNPLSLLAFAMPLLDRRRDKPALRGREWALAGAVFAVFGLSWYLAQLALRPGAFVHSFITFNLLGRAQGSVQQGSFGLYGGVWWGLAPASLVLLGLAVALAALRARSAFRQQSAVLLTGALLLLALSWFPSKRDTYLLMVYPFASAGAVGLLWPALAGWAPAIRRSLVVVLILGLTASFFRTYVAFPDYAPDIKRAGRALRSAAGPGDVVIADVRAMSGVMFYAEREVHSLGVGSLAEAVARADPRPGRPAFAVVHVKQIQERERELTAGPDACRIVGVRKFGKEFGWIEFEREGSGGP